ncbi:MAG: ribonuclease Z [Flavobacteriales bacterium]|nr:ribonuclease Z [Flavobacteriales bacterium]
MQLTILGYNSAIPTMHSNPTAQYLNIRESGILIDCGEGTQVQLRKAKIKFNSINQIFISHLHGDHVFGLPGFLSTLALLGRTTSLTIYGPKGIKEFIENQLKVTQSRREYELIFIELHSTQSELIFENKKFEVYTIPLNHRTYTNGYLFKEKPLQRNLNIEAIKHYSEIQTCDYQNIKDGKDFILSDGFIVKNESLTFDPPKPKSYAFCSDTMYNESILPIIKEVDLLYHEATFLEELKKLAFKTGHSTALEAGSIASQANVKKLIIGHFSNRYLDYNVLLEEAKQQFKNTELPITLQTIDI